MQTFNLINDQNFTQKLYENYTQYKEWNLKDRYFNHKDLQQLIHKLAKKRKFKVNKLGKSVEKRVINQIKTGSGKIKVLIFSQMHGDEPTGTAAIFDILNFLAAKDDFQLIKEKILKNISIFFVPMVNPDGAETFSRLNTWGIDINRDAQATLTPEALLLSNFRKDFIPDFAINLHDQELRYRPCCSDKPAILSFLAPAIDCQKTVNTVRKNSMKIIAEITEKINHYIPNQIGRYTDSFDSRCFGDMMQKAGTSTITIEAGALLDDRERQFTRKMNFVTILSALHSIATNSYSEKTTDDYFNIPENRKDFADIIIRNVKLKRDSICITTDISIEREEKSENGIIHTYAKIKEIGDLSKLHAYEEIDADGLEIVPGKTFVKKINNLKSLRNITFKTFTNILKLGFTTLIIKKLPANRDINRLPFHFVTQKVKNEIAVNQEPNFVLQDKNKTVHFSIVNGFLFDLRSC